MTDRTPYLPPKLEAVLAQIGRSANLSVTQAVKIPYIVDVVSVHLTGERITEGSHEAWKHGVVTEQAWQYLTHCDDSARIRLESASFSEEKKLIVDDQDGEAIESPLTPGEQALVDVVVQEFAHVGAVDLGQLTKFMNPAISRWGSNQAASVDEDAFDRLSDDYQAMAEVAARLTLDQLRRNYEVVEDIEDAIA